MLVYIGVDGGGTGCRAQAELQDGRRTQVMQGSAANVATDLSASAQTITMLLHEVTAQAQTLVPEACLSPRLVLGLAGVREAHAEAALRAALPFPAMAVLGDIEIALAGAFGPRDGIVMAVGTGSVLASQRGGQMQRIGGHGLVLGDEGSGAWLGREALRHTLRARDGLAPDGPLVAQIGQRFGSQAAMIRFARDARPADFAALAPLVLATDRAHCPAAGAILDQGCDWLRRGIARLQGNGCALPVAALGGLGPALLARIIAQGGAALTRVAPDGTGLDGALWLARQGRQHKGQAT